MRSIKAALALALLMPAAAAHGQDAGASLRLEAMSDDRRRGLSWSGGAPAAGAALHLPVAGALSLDAGGTVFAGRSRHAGARGVIDLSAGAATTLGAWTLTADAALHHFPGKGDAGFTDLGVRGATQLGPASLGLAARYAPRQSGIGGDNLYLGADLSAGLPGTPLTLSAHAGRSSGTGRDPVRSARLRPENRYHDYSLGADYVVGRWVAGLRFTTTDIPDGAARADAGSALIASLALDL